MYIAFKWLTGLATAMWVAMCSVDMYVESRGDVAPELALPVVDTLLKNLTLQVEFKSKPRLPKYRQHIFIYQQQSVAMIHCYMFFAGALAVSIFNKKTEIILYAKNKVSKLDMIKFKISLKNNIVRPLVQIGLQMLKCSIFIYNYMRMLTYSKIMITCSKIKSFVRFLSHKENRAQQNINMILLKKLKEVGEERRNLGQLLIAAIHENKNIRMQYQLESMAKTRLLRHIDDTHKQIKENRSRYVSFQHLYLVTHQENIFLKNRIKKLQKEKEEAEKNLLSLINEVYKSKNKELKSYCSRFIVHTKDNLFNLDVSAEIRKFLSSQKPESREKKTEKCDANTGVRITEILNEDDGLVPLVFDAPKLKGLPGECVWTVKDKDGIIEKLYEYDYDADLDNGDTIQRIRKYSVYCDEECLLDYKKSTTVIPDTNAEARIHYSFTKLRQGNFLTGSRAFQRFLRDNNNIVINSPSLSSLPSPLQLSG